MLRETTKPHRIKWIEAERELATRGIYPPSHSIGHVHFPVGSDHGLPHQNKIHDPQENRRSRGEIT